MSRPTIFARLLGVALIFGAAGSALGCEVAAYPGNYYGDYPPAAYIATTDPYYFDGQAAYWYNNRWFYRNGNGWGGYAHEPAGLAVRRSQGGPARVNYGRNAAPRGGGGARGGGGRGGARR